MMSSGRGRGTRRGMEEEGRMREETKIKRIRNDSFFWPQCSKDVFNIDLYTVHLMHDHLQLTFNCVGFLCPVHTPDGSPCGLLNHLAAACQVL